MGKKVFLKRFFLIISVLVMIIAFTGCLNFTNSFSNQYISFNIPNNTYVDESQDHTQLTGRIKGTAKNGGYDTISYMISIMPVSPTNPSDPNFWLQQTIWEDNSEGIPILRTGVTYVGGVKACYIYDNYFGETGSTYYFVKNNTTYSIDFIGLSENEIQTLVNSIKIKK